MNQLNGFCEISLAGKLRGFKFGTNATALFCQMNNLNLIEALTRMAAIQLVDLRDLIYCAYKTNCLLKGLEDEAGGVLVMGEWLDEIGTKEYEILLLTLQSSNTFGGVGAAGKSEDKKKTTPGKT
jgi:hypothetical protein